MTRMMGCFTRQPGQELFMPRKRRPLFVLADGGRARLIERHPETRALITIAEVDGAGRLDAARAAARARP